MIGDMINLVEFGGEKWRNFLKGRVKGDGK